MKVNIPKSNLTAHFRYTREVIEIQIIDKNGGMTQLKNLETIAKTIYSKPDDILKFIQKKINIPKPTNDKTGIFLRKRMTVDEIEELLEEYIAKNVLCPKCNNPEHIAEKELKKCKACGHSR